MTGDLFICHASEDKQVVARPLTEKLRAANYSVWYDEDQLLVGDDLTEKIARGLSQSRYVIVILSRTFFEKQWTFRELHGAGRLEHGKTICILPVWHGVSVDEVNRHYPWLAQRRGVPTDQGVEHVAQQLIQAIEHEKNQIALTADNQPIIHPRSLELLLAARHANGEITLAESLSALHVRAGNGEFGPATDPRCCALNRFCIDELEQHGLVSRYGRSAYKLTMNGYSYEEPAELRLSETAGTIPQVSSANAGLAREILFSAVEGDGRLHLASTSGSSFLTCGSRFSPESSDQRTIALWEDALGELDSIGLLHMTAQTAHSQCYRVTHLGYLWTDFMKTLSGDSQTDQKGQTDQ